MKLTDHVTGGESDQPLIGEGGMGFVVEAVHVALGRGVAIKLMKPEIAQSPGAERRFLREARAAVHIESQHVARVLDVARLEARDVDALRLGHQPEDLGRTDERVRQRLGLLARGNARALGLIGVRHIGRLVAAVRLVLAKKLGQQVGIFYT